MKIKKITLIILTSIISFVTMGQTNTTSLKTYLSNYQISESDASIGKVPYKIIVDDAKLNRNVSGYVKLVDLEQKSTLLTLKLKYWKTTKDNDGITYWFNLYGNAKFNIFKICNWTERQNIKGKLYKSIIIFSLYDEYENRISDFGFLGNKTN